ncbi:MAG: Zn-dependent hydrolase [Acidobacteria bacterium]|nr:MAG: Zn-dependent hydrolase [Acidobacteriota bacterium]
MHITINSGQLYGELERLASFTDAPPPAVTRIVFSDTDLAARAYIKGLCTAANLAFREDAIGNLFVRWPGREPGLPPIGTGSHTDAIPHAGWYDGTVGVLGGLEAIRALQRGGFQPRRSIELVMFTSEEPTRFGIGCLGSRLMSGSLPVERARALVDRAGQSLDQVRTAAGFTGTLDDVVLPRGYYEAFLEMHVEQGPVLEQRNIAVGVVTAIAAPASLRIWIDGEGGHAGTVLMPQRCDAFLAAAEISLAVESAAKSTGAIDTVATVGICDVFPGAVNSIPSRVKIEIDVRDIDLTRRDTVLRAIDSACDGVIERRGVRVKKEMLNADPPAQSSRRAVDILTQSCQAFGIPSLQMVSRAYHDSLFMSRITEFAMLFIRCREGISHRPDEYASPEDIATGTKVLAQALAQLSSL